MTAPYSTLLDRQVAFTKSRLPMAYDVSTETFVTAIDEFLKARFTYTPDEHEDWRSYAIAALSDPNYEIQGDCDDLGSTAAHIAILGGANSANVYRVLVSAYGISKHPDHFVAAVKDSNSDDFWVFGDTCADPHLLSESRHVVHFMASVERGIVWQAIPVNEFSAKDLLGFLQNKTATDAAHINAALKIKAQSPNLYFKSYSVERFKSSSKDLLEWTRLAPNFDPAEPGIACNGTGELLVFKPLLRAMQAVRDELGVPCYVNSLYRSRVYNEQLRRQYPEGDSRRPAKNSTHILGQAWDFTAHSREYHEEHNDRIVEVVKKHFYGVGVSKTYTHGDLKQRRGRQIVTWRY